MHTVFKITLLFMLFLFPLRPLFPSGSTEDSTSGKDLETEYAKARETMVKTQIEARGVRDAKVLHAMKKVQRHMFVPQDLVQSAYIDSPLPIGYGQTISQPYIVAYMTELLQLKGDEKVLEIGTGSGYQAAVLAEITPHVCTIEIIPELAEQARRILEEEGYVTVKARNGDGYYGWEEEAPFDAIIVTAAAGHVPPPLLSQLKPGGKVVIPIGGVYEVQMLTLVEKLINGSFRTEQLLPVRFVPLTGQATNR
ncbi:MAG TPA: protein-L-isoaspartate(D-aspartate) O-methyltransferase [Spirochaetia bacterium]|nr:protein-L-isoaspartate(D-aspartate) O-methyltransferase [Spirochaetia bacterium]